MPIYEYLCRACHTNFEALVPTSRRDGSDTACPKCGQTKVARKISLMAQPIVKSQSFDCGASGGCCGGACGLEE